MTTNQESQEKQFYENGATVEYLNAHAPENIYIVKGFNDGLYTISQDTIGSVVTGVREQDIVPIDNEDDYAPLTEVLS